MVKGWNMSISYFLKTTDYKCSNEKSCFSEITLFRSFWNNDLLEKYKKELEKFDLSTNNSIQMCLQKSINNSLLDF